jgi:cytochrome P450
VTVAATPLTLIRMDPKPPRPSRITPPEEPLGPLRLIREVVANPMQVWPARIYREPLVRWRALGQEMVFVVSPDLIQDVLMREADAFDKGEIMMRALKPALGEAILTADGERWRWQRRAASPIFRQEVIDGFLPIMARAAGRAVARWLAAPARELDISHEMMRVTFEVILETMLPGQAKMDVARMERAITHYLESIGWVTALALMRAPQWMPYPGYLRARRALAFLRRSLAEVVSACRAREGGKDLAALLGQATDPQSGQRMSGADLADNLLTFITAGHETTAVALAWTFYLLSLDRGVEERVAAEVASVVKGDELRPEHVEALVETRQAFLEAMRLYPPVPVLARSPTRDMRLAGEAIPRGLPVYVPIYALHRHTTLWEDPDAFDPARFDRDAVKGRHRFAYIPFGAGPRICIGMSFAQTEAIAILATIIRSARLRLAPGYAPRLRMRATLRPAGGMPMLVEPR